MRAQIGLETDITYASIIASRDTHLIVSLKVHEDSGVKVAYCRNVVGVVLPGPVLFHVVDADHAALNSIPYLFSLAVNHEVAPALSSTGLTMMFLSDVEEPWLESVVYLCMCFNYDCLILSKANDVACVLSRLGACDIYSISGDPSQAKKAIESLLVWDAVWPK